MKLIIAGGRNQILSKNDRIELDRIHDYIGISEVVSGGAEGVDKCGEQWAVQNNRQIRGFLVTKENWKKLGLKAGPMRNKQMAEYADALALFPGGKGTLSMHNEACKAGLQIFDFR